MPTFLKLAFRHLMGARGYTALNLLGLSIGIICCLFLFQYVGHETSFDSFHRNADRTVRVRMSVYEKGQLSQESATVFPALGAAMKKDFPEVQDYCRLMAARVFLANPDRTVQAVETSGFYADPSFLHIFTLPLIKGDAASALDGPNKMVISEDMARKYFGNENPIGKRFRAGGQPAYYYPIWKYGQTESFDVTGVFRNYPANSHLSISYLISYPTFVGLVNKAGGKQWQNAAEDAWEWYDMWTYLELRPGADAAILRSQLPAFADRHVNYLKEMRNNQVRYEFDLVPLRDIHLYSHDVEEAGTNGNGKTVYFLLLIGVLIISIGWVNYTNLATARSLERSREVGVRKVLGASRGDLVRQFLLESLLMNGVALLLAIGLCFALGPLFNQLTGGGLAGGFRLGGRWLANFLVLFTAGAVLSGLYPAFILSGYHPVVVLRGLFKNSAKGLFLRKALIIGQFTASVLLIGGTIIVYRQVNYMRNQQLGIDIRQTLVLSGARSFSDSAYRGAYQSFRNDLLRLKSVKSVAASNDVMGNEIVFGTDVGLENAQSGSHMMFYTLVDYDFLPAYKLRLLAGRNFSQALGRDRKGIILNETAVKTLGFSSPGKVVHQYVRAMDDSMQVIGVVA